MTTGLRVERHRILDPQERSAEFLFGPVGFSVNAYSLGSDDESFKLSLDFAF
jgi:hypothetical protein